MTMSNGQQTSFPLDQETEALPGALPDATQQAGNIRSYVSEEAADEIPFGVMLAQGTADRQCLLVAAETDHFIGISVRSQAYQVDHQLGDTGVKPKNMLAVLTKGRIMVKVADAVSPGDPVRVNQAGGTFQTASGGVGVTTDISANAQWLTSAGVDGVAELQFDMAGLNTNKVAD